MDTRPSLERIRAWAAGELSADERRAFERELSADAELSELAQAYARVHALTALDAAVPECAASLEPIERRIDAGRPRPLRRVAALAAGILVIVSAVLWSRGAFHDAAETAPDEPLSLRTIPLAAGDDTLARPEPLPPMLARYQPVDEDGIHWMRRLDQARAVASATRRPIFLFVRYEQCPVADRLRRTALADTRVRELAGECVPCEVDILSFPEETVEKILSRGYPLFALESGEGEPIADFSGDYAGETGTWVFGERLREGLDLHVALEEPVPWSLARDLTELRDRGWTAEDEGRYAEAQRLYEELVAHAAGPEFSESGRRGLLRIALAARDELIAARALADRSAEEAEAALARAVERFRGTPQAAELARVLERLRVTGVFPLIDWAS